MPKALHHGRHEQHVQIIRAANPITPDGSRRFEVVLLDLDAFDFAQRVLRGFEQAQPVLGRHHAGFAAHEQRVAGDVAQAPSAALIAGCD